jgi:hypothetical protein
VNNKVPQLIAGLTTFFILIVAGIASLFVQMVAFNGVSESKGFNAMSISVVCQSVVLILAVIFARWVSRFLITKFNLNKALAVLAAILTASGLGLVLAFVSVVIAIPISGIR